MIALALRRTLVAIPTLLFIGLAIFTLVEFVPGDVAFTLAGEGASAEDIAETRERLGLDDPFLTRYTEWLSHAVRGDLGSSLYSEEPVTDMLWQRLPVTASVALVAMFIIILVGVPLGFLAAANSNSLLDRLVSGAASLSMSLPPFLVGLLLVLTFGISLGWFPATGYRAIGERGVLSWLSHLWLPALAIASTSAAQLARQTRAAAMDVITMDYVRTARAVGLRRGRILLQRVLKNSGVPIATTLGLQASNILAGSVTVEFIFALPGLGGLAVNAVSQRDVPVIIGVVILSAVVVLVVNLLVDLSYYYFNPRLRG